MKKATIIGLILLSISMLVGCTPNATSKEIRQQYTEEYIDKAYDWFENNRPNCKIETVRYYIADEPKRNSLTQLVVGTYEIQGVRQKFILNCDEGLCYEPDSVVYDRIIEDINKIFEDTFECFVETEITNNVNIQTKVWEENSQGVSEIGINRDEPYYVELYNEPIYYNYLLDEEERHQSIREEILRTGSLDTTIKNNIMITTSIYIDTDNVDCYTLYNEINEIRESINSGLIVNVYNTEGLHVGKFGNNKNIELSVELSTEFPKEFTKRITENPLTIAWYPIKGHGIGSFKEGDYYYEYSSYNFGTIENGIAEIRKRVYKKNEGYIRADRYTLNYFLGMMDK